MLNLDVPAASAAEGAGHVTPRVADVLPEREIVFATVCFALSP